MNAENKHDGVVVIAKGEAMTKDETGAYVITEVDDDGLVVRLQTTDPVRAAWAAQLQGGVTMAERDGVYTVDGIHLMAEPMADAETIMGLCREYNLRRMKAVWQVDPGGVGDKDGVVDIMMAKHYAGQPDHPLAASCQFALNHLKDGFRLVIGRHVLLRHCAGYAADILRAK